MSLDSIVNITIDTKSLQMAQAGFGTPLIIAEHIYLKDRVASFKTLSEVFELRDKENEKKLPDEQKFNKDPLYLTAQAIFAQKPTVRKIKLGKREPKESVLEALEAISRQDADGDFYGVLLVSKNPQIDYPALADAVSTKRLLAGVDLELSHLDIAKALKASNGARRIFAIFKDAKDNYPAAAWMGKMLAQQPGSASWAFKDLEGIKKSKINTHTEEQLKEALVNRHIDINNVGITLDGKVSKDEYIDIIHGIDWLHVRMQERLLRLFVLNNKIPYTAKGIDLVRCEILAQLSDAVSRGFLAADPEPLVSIPNIEDIDESKRNERKLPDVCFSARLAGAIHEIEIRGTVTT